MADVTLTEITKSFGKVDVIHGVSITIVDGEFVALVGPSGCGKSTMLRMIAGLEDPTTGEIAIGGQIVNDRLPKDRNIAMVFQSYALYPHMTVRKNIAFPLRMAGLSQEEQDKKVNAAAKVLNLDSYIERRPGQLSGGQRQRVAIGRAIVREPSAFLFDEPLSNLDASLRVNMRLEISELHNTLKTTMVYVTHDQVEAMTMGDRVAVIKNGVLQQVDTPQELYADPKNVFVAAFIGSPAMNLFEGTVEGNTVRIGSQSISLPQSALDAHPDLANRQGQMVVVGIRPEDLEDATVTPDHPADQRLRSEVTLVEALGSELVTHFNLDAKPVDAGDPDAEDPIAGANVATVVGRFSPRSTVRQGDTVEIAIDAAHLHFFDHASGQTLRV